MITKYFIKKHILKSINSQRLANLIDFNEAKSIAIVTYITKDLRYEDAGEELNRFADHSKNSFFFFAPPKLQLPVSFNGGRLTQISQKDFSFFGFPKRRLLAELETEKFDLLINIDVSGSIFSHFLSAVIPAKFKIGLSADEYTNIYDLSLRMAENNTTNEFFKHLNFYLRALKGKPNEK